MRRLVSRAPAVNAGGKFGGILMKKPILLLTSCLLLVSTTAGQNQAWDTPTPTFSSARSSIGLTAGLALFSKDNYSRPPVYGIVLDLRILPPLSLEIRALRFQNDVSAEDDDLFPGTLTAYPLSLSLKWHLTRRSRLAPYFRAGVNYTLMNQEVDLPRWEALQFSGKNDIAASPGFQAAMGIDLFIGKKIAFNLEAGYLYIRNDVDWEVQDTVSAITASGTLESVQFDFISATGGIRFYL